ncbi:hypothetical protein ACFL6I_22105, partial [candidate division KSB1 bacterium]
EYDSIPSDLIENFIYKVREIIDKLSTQKNDCDRKLFKTKLKCAIIYYLLNSGLFKLNDKVISPNISEEDEEECVRNRSKEILPPLKEDTSFPEGQI